jgi:hypothetical protein
MKLETHIKVQKFLIKIYLRVKSIISHEILNEIGDTYKSDYV